MTFYPQKWPCSSFENNTGQTEGPTDRRTSYRDAYSHLMIFPTSKVRKIGIVSSYHNSSYGVGSLTRLASARPGAQYNREAPPMTNHKMTATKVVWFTKV